MKRFLSLCLLLAGIQVVAMDYAGMKFDDTVKITGQDLAINGKGVRIKYMIAKVYVAVLYTQKKTPDAESIINGSGPRRMSLTMLRTLQVDDLYKSLIEGMTNNSTPAEMTALAPKLKQVKEGFDAVNTVEKGDLVTMDFLPGKGTVISVRGKPFETIEGDEFAHTLLKIWFGKTPIQDDLKLKLLGSA